MNIANASGSIQLRHLRNFVVIVEELHFTRAAARLCMAQQTLSHQIIQLEKMLGAQLIDRTTRRVELTPVGEEFYQHAVKMTSQFADAISSIHQLKGRDIDTLRLAFTPCYSGQAHRLRTAVNELRPSLKLSLMECWTEQAVEGVARGRYDAALVNSSQSGGALDCFEVAPTEVGVAISALSSVAQSDLHDWDSKKDLVCAIWPRSLSPAMYDLIVRRFALHVQTNSMYEFETLTRGLFLDDETACRLILAGKAFTPATRQQVEAAGAAYSWRSLSPSLTIGCQLLFRPAAQSSPVTLILAGAQTSLRGALSRVNAAERMVG